MESDSRQEIRLSCCWSSGLRPHSHLHRLAQKTPNWVAASRLNLPICNPSLRSKCPFSETNKSSKQSLSLGMTTVHLFSYVNYPPSFLCENTILVSEPIAINSYMNLNLSITLFSYPTLTLQYFALSLYNFNDTASCDLQCPHPMQVA